MSEVPALREKRTVGRWRLIAQGPPPHRDLCTDCGVSRMANPKACATACQFIAPDYARLEQQSHGRTRGLSGDEPFFGVTQRMHRASYQGTAPGAQWTGLTTALAERALRDGRVDAVVTVAADPEDRWAPEATIITEPAALAAARGMRMGYAPVVAAVERAQALGFRRLAVIALPCQSYALRSLEASLGLEALYLIGTPCSDNTSTAHFHRFLAALDSEPDRIRYLEFCPDYHVEVRYEGGQIRRIPFLQLPLQDLGDDFFPLTCQSCVDYTNSLADITVGYMAGTGAQWVVVRNDRGDALLEALGTQVTLTPLESQGKRTGPVKGFLDNTRRAAGGLPLRRMPAFLRPLMGWLMPRIGPRGLEFARARLEMKAIEAVLHLRRARPAKLRHMLPQHLWRLVAPYGLRPEASEAPPASADGKG